MGDGWVLDKEAWMRIIHELMQDETMFSIQKLDWLIGNMGYFDWLKEREKEENYAARNN